MGPFNCASKSKLLYSEVLQREVLQLRLREPLPENPIGGLARPAIDFLLEVLQREGLSEEEVLQREVSAEVFCSFHRRALEQWARKICISTSFFIPHSPAIFACYRIVQVPSNKPKLLYASEPLNRRSCSGGPCRGSSDFKSPCRVIGGLAGPPVKFSSSTYVGGFSRGSCNGAAFRRSLVSSWGRFVKGSKTILQS